MCYITLYNYSKWQEVQIASMTTDEAWQHMDTELGMKDDMSWCCALLGYHPKSSQDHWQGQTEKKQDFLGFYIFQTHLGCRWLLQMTAADTFWPGTISPHIASMQFHPWGGGGEDCD